MRRLLRVSPLRVRASVICIAAIGVSSVVLAQSTPPQPQAADQAAARNEPPASAQQPGVSAAPPDRPKRPPFPNRANEVMPSWLRVRGEFRERVERFDNAGFVEGRDDAFMLSRVRLTAVAAGKDVSATLQVHDARVGDKTIGPVGAPFKAAFDVRQGFVEVGGAKRPLAARLGRQELAFGDQRLIGHAGWLNAARTFDAARITLKAPVAQIDFFAASVVRILDGELDKSGAGNRFAGAYVTNLHVVPRAIAEPYVLWRRDVNLRSESAGIGTLQQVTTGARLAGSLPAGVDYVVEMDLQRGSLGADAVRAWAGHWQARKSLAARMAAHVIGEYNYASGDSNPTDGIRETFDQLYPTAHDKYGLADQVGWRNIHHARAGFDVSVAKATPVAVNYHSYWLADRRDALYAASGAPIARVAAGTAGAHVGQEIDVQVSRPISAQLAVTAGYSHLFAGRFLKQSSPGASYSGPFVMATYVFLAEK